MGLEELIRLLREATSGRDHRLWGMRLELGAANEILKLLVELRERRKHERERSSGTASSQERKKFYEEFNSAYWWEQVFRAYHQQGGDFRWQGGFEDNSSTGYKRSNQRPSPKAASKPWYEILGCRATATKVEVMKAYRSLAMRYHPDRKPHGNAEKMAEINVAKDEALGGFT